MSNINEWLSADMIEGEGNYNVTLTASAYNGANNRTTRLAVIGNNKTKYVNIIQLKEGDVEIPTDVENCFYVSPTTIAGTEVMFKDNENATEGGFYYYVNNEWREVQVNTPITINKRTYFKNLNRVPLQVDGGQIWGSFSLKGLCNVGGNIETLLGEMREHYAIGLFVDSDIVDASNLLLPATTLSYGCYQTMFYGNKYLIKTPTLPATTLNQYCYYGMFYGCSSLVTAPTLPSLSLRNAAYAYMFANCENLVNAPQLPATWVAQYAYECMFQNCKSLIVAPSLPTTELTPYCYFRMFKGCSSLSTPPSLTATTLAEYCYAEMFVGCTSLINAPALPATTLTDYCYSAMFGGCTNLETAPVLEAMELKKSCYWMMFQDCPKINYIKMLATTLYGVEGDDDFSLREWVDGVAEYGTFVKHPDMDSLTRGINGIPTLWKVRNDGELGYIDVSTNELDMTDNLTATISVFSNVVWTAETDADWITITPNEGIAGNEMQVTITAEDYPEYRESVISFYIDGIKKEEIVVYQKGYVITPTDVENCFYIEPITDEGTTIKLFDNDYNVKPHFYYYYNYKWEIFRVNQTLTIKKKTYIKDFDRYINDENPIDIKGLCNIGGNIETLLGEMFNEYAKNLFVDSDIVDASNLILPATKLYWWCYQNMFEGSSSLVNPPMLPASTLTPSCYHSMFAGCSSLNNITMLAIDISEEGCLGNWVNGVSPTGTFIKHPQMNNLPIGINGIPEGWEVRDYDFGFEFSVDVDDIDLTHNLTATINVTSNTNWSVEYNGNWFSVSPTSGDGNGSITVTANGYNNSISIKDGYISFISSNLEVYRVRIYQGIEPFEGCFYIEPNTSDNEVTVRLSVGTMDAYVYYFVDNEWRELKGDNPITINKRTYFKNYLRAYYNWEGFFIGGLCNIGGNIETLLGEMRDQYAYKLFENCDIVDASNLILPATTLGRLCYNDMFNGCSSLVNPPTLPATTLNQYCYEQMFYGCTSLNNITMLATNISADSCLKNWVWGVSPTGIFYKNPNMNDLPTGNSGIPSGWEVRDYEG